MGYFKESKTEKIALDSNPNYWVEVLSDMTWGDMKKMAESTESDQVGYQADAMLLALIRAWNLDDDAGVVLPITQENIDRLARVDVEKIVKALGGKVEEPVETKKAS